VWIFNYICERAAVLLFSKFGIFPRKMGLKIGRNSEPEGSKLKIPPQQRASQGHKKACTKDFLKIPNRRSRRSHLI
jgi:hypothetical protein